jgi:hypothetical protein
MREVSDLVDQYKEEEDAAAKELLRTIASKIVESFDNHGLSAAQIARQVRCTCTHHACNPLPAQSGSVTCSALRVQIVNDVARLREQITVGAEAGEAAQKASVGETLASKLARFTPGGGGQSQQEQQQEGGLAVSGVTSDTILGNIGETEGVQDCTDLPGLPKSSKFCLEGRPYTKLPGIDAAMTSGDMRQKIKELKLQAKQNLGIPNAAKVDQEELAKLQDIVKTTKKALNEQEAKLKEIKDSKHTAMQDLAAQKRILSMAKDARQQRLAWRAMDTGMSQAYKDAGFKLPLSAGGAPS